LVTESSFNGFIGVIDNDKLLSIAVQNQNENFLTIPKQHWWNELHATACGRVLLASLSTTERDKLFARTSRQKLTTKTVIDSEELERICNQVATDGYSEVQDESRQGISSLAVPLRDLTGTVFAGMAISATNDKWQTIPLQRKLKFLSDAIERL
jgi:DNA-binding IclR family transcriptional regulator